MTSRDIQLELQEHLSNATLATDTEKLVQHLAAFSRDWKLEPSLIQFDSALQLLSETRQGASFEAVALWWLGYIQDIALNRSIPRLSPTFGQALFRSADLLADLLQSPSTTLVKRTIQVCASIYPVVFEICSQDTPIHFNLWNEYAIKIKQLVLRQFNHGNEGVTISLCKYVQTVIQIQSFSHPQSQPGSHSLGLNSLPQSHPFLSVNMLQQEADRLLQELLSTIRRPNISSTLVTAIVNQTSALQRARPQFIPSILRTWIAFTKPPPPHFTALQTKFIDKSIRIQILALTKMESQHPPQIQALAEALASYGIKYEGKALARSQQQQLLHPDRDNGDDSKKSGKRVRPSSSGNDDAGSKRIKSEVDTPPGINTPTFLPQSNIPPGFGTTLLGQVNVTHLPLHHVVDVIFETLSANAVPRLFHSFLSSLQVMPLKVGPLPIPPPGVGPPPPGLLLPHPPPLLPGMMPPPGMFPPPMMPGQPPMLPQGAPGAPGAPDIKQEIKKEHNLSKLQLPTVSKDMRVNVVVMPPKHTPVRLPARPIVARTDSVTVARKNEAEKEPKVELKEEPKVEPKLEQHQLKMETFQVKPFEPSDQYPTDSVQPPTADLLKETFLRILSSEHLVHVPAATGKKVLEAAAASAASEESEAMVRFDPANAEHETKVVTKADWMTIISRLLTRAFPRNSEQAAEAHGTQHMKDMMVNYVCSDFKQRRELALIWLHEEWYYDGICQRAGEQDRDPQYLWCLYKILDGITSGTNQLDAKDKGLTRFLLEVPELPEGAVDIIQKYCDDPARAQIGISCLRDVVNLRPPSRNHALDIVLRYTTHPERPQRNLAIVTAKKWYLEHPTVGPRVEEYALAQLDTLMDFPVPKREDIVPPPTESTDVKMEDTDATNKVKDEPMPSAPNEPTPVPSLGPGNPSFAHAEDDVGRHLDLYLSLCAKNHSLLEVLFAHYSSYDPFIQRVIRIRIPPLIKAIKQDSPKFLALIRTFPLGAEMLVLRIINILTDGARPAPGLVSAVQEAVVQHDLNARFLVPIVSGLNKEEVLAALPRIVGLLKGTERERRTVTDVFLKLLTGTKSSGAIAAGSGASGLNRRNSVVAGPEQSLASVSSQPAATQTKDAVLSPSELLVALHSMEDTVGWKAACEAMDICFNHPEIYKSEIIAVVLQQLLDQPTIPSLFMRTVIQAITLYKNLVGFVNSMILARLVAKKVWTRPVLWKGFVRCAKLMQPTSSSVLASLPKPQLKEVLAMDPSLKEPVEAYVKAKSSGRRVGGGAAKQVNLQNVAAVVPPPDAPVPEAMEGGGEREGEGERAEAGEEVRNEEADGDLIINEETQPE
ncbi:hypothetical protein BGZ81_009301 [Podila clonocystis]|nr:hypothetical protein BGZ81_009301 [Podila clonocystis]